MWVDPSLTQYNRLGVFGSRDTFTENAQRARLCMLARKVCQQILEELNAQAELPTARNYHRGEADVRIMSREPRTASRGNHPRSLKNTALKLIHFTDNQRPSLSRQSHLNF